MSDHPEPMICARSGKLMYESRKMATNAAIDFKRRKANRAHRRKNKAREQILEPYYCSHCGSFHLGHRRYQRTKGRGGKPTWAR